MNTKVSKKDLYTIGLIVLSIPYGLGYFGYGIDVQLSYKNASKWMTNPTEIFGWKTTSLYLGHTFIGANIVIILQILSLNNLLKNKNLHLRYHTLIMLCLMTSYPMMLMNINALRQGLAFSLFIYVLSLETYKHKRSAETFIYTILSVLSHNSILFLFLFYFMAKRLKVIPAITMIVAAKLSFEYLNISETRPMLETSLRIDVIFYVMILLSVLTVYVSDRRNNTLIKTVLYALIFLLIIDLTGSHLQRFLVYLLPLFMVAFCIEVKVIQRSKLIFILTFINLIIFPLFMSKLSYY